MYRVDEETFKTAEEAAQYISDNIDSDNYDDMLDECYGEIKFGELSYTASDVLHSVDPIAYDCGFNDYKDGEYQDILYEIERMSDGEILTFYDMDIEYVEEQTLINSKDDEIAFSDLDEAKDYFSEIVNEDYTNLVKNAGDLEDLCDVMNDYSEEFGDGSEYSIES